MKEFLLLTVIVWTILILIEIIFGKLDHGKLAFWCLLIYFILDNIEMLINYLKAKKLKKQD